MTNTEGDRLLEQAFGGAGFPNIESTLTAKTSRVVIKRKRMPEPVAPKVETKQTTAKQRRHERRLAVILERKKNKPPSKPEVLAAQGLRFANFVVGIEELALFAAKCYAEGTTPNDRFNEFLRAEIGGSNGTD